MIPSEYTITLLSSLDDEFENPLPFLSSSFIDLLDIIDYS